jgi:hypothetical protein
MPVLKSVEIRPAHLQAFILLFFNDWKEREQEGRMLGEGKIERDDDGQWREGKKNKAKEHKYLTMEVDTPVNKKG